MTNETSATPETTVTQDARQSSEILLGLKHISYQVNNKLILNDVSLNLKRKDILTIIGPNGAGKSTLVKLVLGLISPSTGEVSRSRPLSFGYVPQKLSIDHSMPLKVGRFMSLAQSTKISTSEALRLLGVLHLRSAQLTTLSGGELQRVLLARAVSRKPDVLVLDEPLQGVDVGGQVELYRLIASLRDQLNCAILMVSHDLHLVMAQTDSVICLNQHICCQGQPESVSQHPEYLRLFGKRAVDDIAVYQHHHDHHHNLHGEAVDCSEACKHG